MGLMAPARWCKGSCNVWGGSRAEQESQMWKGKAVETLQAAAAAWPHVWVFPCGNKLNYQRSGSIYVQGSPEP